MCTIECMHNYIWARTYIYNTLVSCTLTLRIIFHKDTVYIQYDIAQGIHCTTQNRTVHGVSEAPFSWSITSIYSKSWFDFIKQNFKVCVLTLNINYCCRCTWVPINDLFAQEWQRLHTQRFSHNYKLVHSCTFMLVTTLLSNLKPGPRKLKNDSTIYFQNSSTNKMHCFLWLELLSPEHKWENIQYTTDLSLIYTKRHDLLHHLHVRQPIKINVRQSETPRLWASRHLILSSSFL